VSRCEGQDHLLKMLKKVLLKGHPTLPTFIFVGSHGAADKSVRARVDSDQLLFFLTILHAALLLFTLHMSLWPHFSLVV